MVGDRRKVSHEQSFNSIIVNLVCHRVDDDCLEDLYEAVLKQARRFLVDHGFTWTTVEISGPFYHEQPGSENIIFYEAHLKSPNGQCYEAKDEMQFVDWWN